MDLNSEGNKNSAFIDKNELIRYITFWPYFLVSILFFVLSGFFFVKYSNPVFEAYSKIEIYDESQDSEMALPTAMTIFNRSMINIENEIGVLNSHILHRKVVRKLDANFNYFKIGIIKDSPVELSSLYADFDYSINKKVVDTISKKLTFILKTSDKKLIIDKYDFEGNFINSKEFNNYSSTEDSGAFIPFSISINQDDELDLERKIVIYPIESYTDYARENFSVSQTGKDSDQIALTFRGNNKKLNEIYLNTLMNEFDLDGVLDRRLEYQRTMEFADERSDFLAKELKQIENRKQNFKEKNNLTNIESDASVSISQKVNYDTELFNAISQKDLVLLLLDIFEKQDFNKLMPANIGIDNDNINNLISEYNSMITQRSKLMIAAGPNNLFIKNLEKQLIEYQKNISESVDNYIKSLNLTISSLESKENEFSINYRDIPEKEKVLRSIERELEIKESLFLLLLQKREEAAINFAVVKPSIKVIDYSRSTLYPVFPKANIVFLVTFVIGFLFVYVILFLWFYFDNKVHTRNDLTKSLNPEIPVISEIPHMKSGKNSNNFESLSSINSSFRHPVMESIRMLVSSLGFLKSDKNSNRGQVILVTSSIKGEGKTFVSSLFSKTLSFSPNSKVLLIGSDLRNPQIHRYLNVDKTKLGLSDYIYRNNLDWKNLLIKSDELDILLSGTIPPNPIELLRSEKLKELIQNLRTEYDYIIIDSAPCLLVADTFELTKFSDFIFIVTRAAQTTNEIIEFINQSYSDNKLNNLSIILNAVGNSRAYGYKYGYQYGYLYDYKYSYKYGYKYGYQYGEQENSN